MTLEAARPLRIAWLAPDDRGGGVVSVAQACCREAALAGYDPTLLLVLPDTGHAAEFGGFRLESLGANEPYSDVPARLTGWLERNPQDVLLLNGCEQTDEVIPYIPQSTRVVQVVHDTADRYIAAAVRYQAELDGIVAVSQTVADRFRGRLRDPAKLAVVLNGTVFPDLVAATALDRADDLVFLGGDNPDKGAFDVLELWGRLQGRGFEGRLHWFGAMAGGFRSGLSRLRAAGQIVVHGRQPRHAIFELAARAKVLLMLSRVESFGMATIECMGMGCLPVAWDIPTGTKEIVADGEGSFAALGDFDALADGVFRCLKEHSSHCRASSERIRSEFSQSAMWSRNEAMLEALFLRSPACRPLAGLQPPSYRRPFRLFQWLPPALRSELRALVGRSPRLGYLLRDFRGK